MKMISMRKTLLIIMLAAAFALLAGAALADEPDVWISRDGTLTTDAITFNKNEGRGYTLFLPASLKTEEMVFGMAEGVSFTYGSRSIKSGDSAAVIKPGKTQIKIGKQKSSLTVMRGSENLPAVFVTTESGSLKKIESNKENREPGALVLLAGDGEIQYDGTLEHIKCRGNSTMVFKKKNYQIKLSKSTDLLGMGKAKRWILTANYRDKSHLRNQMTLDLAAAAGLSYTPEHCPADLYINHEYRGLYLFSEKVEIDKDRVAITNLETLTEKLNTEKPLSEYKLKGKRKATDGAFKGYEIPVNPEDITGGYLMEYESYPARYKSEPSAYTTKRGNVLVMKSPEYASVEQMQYISALVQSFENAIAAEDGKDPDSGKHYTEIADAESLALKYMIEEISENYDGNSSSQYFYKPADSVSEKLFAGPAWDYDSAYGSYAAAHNAKYVLNPERLWISAGEWTAWYPMLNRHADFRNLVAELWEERVAPLIRILLGEDEGGAEGLQSIAQMQKNIQASADMDRQRWPRPKTSDAIAWTGSSFDDNVKFLQDYLQQRRDFLDTEWRNDSE